ncbi:MAG: hypothetical protein F6J94_14730 [Moorea sp. SIO1F2]|uniref:hypothetical protein n=1 Tax=unclassified Moorena TaxID=2683338 RepID=UPI0013BE43E1|nr:MULTISPECIES: hypothetical protein [unclassified Moorena]NEO03085.1 hypothetical protein [Moorena sp. SIO3I7]NEO09370.1 hypothetical protein [Moorena sp. SIO3I8]NEO22188.1 hypothetical protein [Moorena sp. SIO4A5]NEQ57618.1 hypothetical protein [Moorena sp. SIO4A1]NET83132.1 hypothetical protein [Moorena sp. SIO1F2]
MIKIKNLNVWTGTTLSLLLCTLAMAPAQANPMGEHAQNRILKQDRGQELDKGTIKSIVGNMVKVKLDNGDSQTVWLPTSKLRQLHLTEGKEVLMAGNRILNVVSSSDLASSETRRVTSSVTEVLESLQQRRIERMNRIRRTVISTPVQPTVTTPPRTPIGLPVRALW